MSDALQELTEFEKHADAAVVELPVLRQPVRSLLSAIYLAADSRYVGERFKRKRGLIDDEAGTAIITRMSHVINLLERGTRQIGANIDDALSALDVSMKVDIENLFGYGHFCEVMPLVRRGAFSVESTASGFRLHHPNRQFATLEENDVLLSELALPHDVRLPPHPIEAYKRMAKALPIVPGDDLVHVLQAAYHHYLNNVLELPLISAEAFTESFGFSRHDFIHQRAALMAYADYCLGIADAAEFFAASAVTSPRRQKYTQEVLEWISPLLKRNHMIGFNAALAGVDPDVAEQIVDTFTLDLDNLAHTGGGEGFFPPFLKLDDALLFSPHAVKRMMPERNLLYALLRTNRAKFDEVVSHHLEPALLADAVQCLSAIPGVEIKQNAKWERGEIDLLAYHEASNSALHVQAKAAVPPQGARMVAQIESRTLEGAKQIRRFLNLSGKERDAIASAAIGRKLDRVEWSSAILVRTCLGTEKAWIGISGYIPLNPVLLRVALNKLVEQGDFSFVKLDGAVAEELDALRSTAIKGWSNKSFSLFGKTIDLPLLDLNYAAIAAFRNRALA
ncbi:hypothetical protein [Hyphomicrobium sp. CS1BSMeth3]|uniref:hypothetical protein n=1 Tax=Hyphomicrobium sp. CS1BSMeth3 TaxID=1892844 RepID=UPI000930BF9F|nr:hypothetical protein [Hyphomicrobium sp. CS1BSMeth3]